MPAEGVTLSGMKDCRRIALRRSPFPLRGTKDAEGARPLWVNLSGKRTEVQALNGFVSYAEFLLHTKILLFTLCSKVKEKNVWKIFGSGSLTLTIQ